MYPFAIRTIERDSVFLMADVVFDGAEDPVRVSVRNLSAAGMMVERDRRVKRGQRVTVTLRNIGAVTGMVIWTRMPRFGIAFHEEIDHQRACARMLGQPGSRPAHAIDYHTFAPGLRRAGELRCVRPANG